MKKLKIILIFAVIIASGKLFAQQDPSYTLYKYNMNIINPAYVGSNEYTELNLNFRSQWLNIEDSPETQSLSFAKPVNEKIGLGLSIVKDQVDIIRETSYTIDFSYKLQVSESSDLYLGLKAGGYTFSADFLSKGIRGDNLFSENVNRFNPVVGAGAYFKTDKFYATVSVPNVLNGKRVARSNEDYAEATDELHLFAGAGYTFDINEDLKFSPSFMTRFVQGAKASVDLTGTFDIYEKVELGASYRLDDSISAIGLFKLADWFQLGYAYEFTTSDIIEYSNNTHEVMLRFKLN
ncbi:PorP/SprF family type IX secretion system membrane protein [Urechidicola croceus]|uniref:Type IX secretion system membrane protein PorP/SprF n=1 Tax=Urechidicola croceus TaxID=1850246 RepID=A0A1D8P8P2_9FLAO|nr:type IX secretion system membrane protein PorP/SprF [Urechidicola croceus]AOW20935.1 hypothetical protein LPB138_09735 [Urechidicola croceus]